MSGLGAHDFVKFFREANGFDPFPWQRMLVERVASGAWPEAIDLPTASGKTACLDVAVYTLAMQADVPAMERTARRRMFLVVDRRIVVDEAYERAKRLAEVLAGATSGVVREVADRLRGLAGGPTALVASRLRGGTLRDTEWRASPAQPAIVTGTVDQVGSRMLFQSYGASDLTAPIDAALTVCDSLVLLDEAHCAVPFLQTASAVRRYASSAWAEVPVAPGLVFTVLSATPPREAGSVFPELTEREAALDHPELRQRTGASKPAQMVRTGPRGELGPDPLVAEAVDQAGAMLAAGRRRVAVMVNRVATAAEVYEGLSRNETAAAAELVLLTGRMRPVDRDELVGRWTPALKARSPEVIERPVVVVTTQCLEVGADFSFDGLVSECASLDALRQRFGRLNRLGRNGEVSAAILVRADQVARGAEDPIYGTALRETWGWLLERATASGRGRRQVRTVDLGIDALDALLPVDPAERHSILDAVSAPAPAAPVLLPAHLDLLAQTAPRPAATPDPAVFLHGPGREAPEAYVVWRGDLEPKRDDVWIDVLALLPPTTIEALAVPLWRVRRWLSGRPLDGDAGGDVEGEAPPAGFGEGQGRRPFVIWKGRERSTVTGDVRKIAPGDLVVVPANEGFAARLGASFQRPQDGDGQAPLDVAECAYPQARGKFVLRASRAVLGPWLEVEPVRGLVEWAEGLEPDETLLPDLLARLAAPLPELGRDEAAELPMWLTAAGEALAPARAREPLRRHPAGGVILIGRGGAPPEREESSFADNDDAASESGAEVPLEGHLGAVEAAARVFAMRCIEASLVDDVAVAAAVHDLGKLDERFQALLLGSALAAAAAAEPVAKSAAVPASPARRRALRAATGLPLGFRHEMLSLQLATRAGVLPAEESRRALVAHLITSHHGHGRPFAPVCHDPEPPGVKATVGGREVALDGVARCGVVPAHRVDSRVAEGYWRSVRRHGWWGLAYLEAMLRLADWTASAGAVAAVAEGAEGSTAPRPDAPTEDPAAPEGEEVT